ncbi:MAG TPA: efflux RND transporter periplasmic adaptor subunit [Vicinamibacterales bacterium]|nr:efflux RND transporter periplasmic adaptor subunit [Vicinamibacterales bacterium]
MSRIRLSYVVVTVIAAGLVATIVWLVRRPSAAAESEEGKAQPTEVAVKVGKVSRATLHAYVTGFGAVEPEPATAGLPAASAKIGSPVAGLLAESHAIEGQRVEKGTVLFQLDSRVADVQVEKARQAADFADRAFDRQKRLLSVDATSQKLYQEAEAQARAAHDEFANAQAQSALLTIHAPITGTITRVLAKPGDAIDVTTVLAEMVDLERLVVSAKIRSADIGVVRRGQRVELSPGRPDAPEQVAAPTGTVTATVSYISPAVDPATDTVMVRAALPRQSTLRPGQFVTARILYDEHRDRLAVPIDSVVTDADGKGAFVAIVNNNTATKKPVRVGIKENGLAEVESPDLHDGTAIVASGAYGLPDTTRIKPIAQ